MINPRARRGAYTTAEAFAVSLHTAREAMAEVRSWPGYQPTPLRPLPDVAEALGLAEVVYKDEGRRFGLGSFKSLGGAYAATRLLHEMGGDPAGQTLCCATDGNHGRSVAYAAHRSGCRCVVYMHAHAPEQKAQAIAALGAEVVRVQGDYDESVRAVARAAAEHRWVLVADTSEDPHDQTTLCVMQGYGVMVLELMDQMPAPPTHIVLQGGVGGLAAGVAGPFSDALGERRPTMLIVEPVAAAALFESACHGRPTPFVGDLRTAMEMLSAGEVSAAAWPILQKRIDAFMTIEDEAAVAAAQSLARRDAPISAGVSGAAGLAGLIAAVADHEMAEGLGLDASSRVLVFGTEAAD